MKQTALFEFQEDGFDALSISGLRYIPHFISSEAEAELIRIIDQQPWLTDLRRRVQHYGYR